MVREAKVKEKAKKEDKEMRKTMASRATTTTRRAPVLRPYVPDVELYPDERLIRIAKDPIRLKEDEAWRASLPPRQWYDPPVPVWLPSVAPERRIEHSYKLLWKQGEDVNQRAEGGTTPLWWAAEAGDLQMAALLLEKRADPSLTDTDSIQELPLHKAAMRGDSTMCELLLKESAKRGMGGLVERENASGFTALQLCVKRRDTATLRQLLEYKADLNRANAAMGGDSPLVEVIRSREMDYVERLILYGASVNQANVVSDQPLHVAASMLWEGCVELLIRSRADPASTNGRGHTPLEIAEGVVVAGGEDEAKMKERSRILKMLSAYCRGPPVPRRTDARFDRPGDRAAYDADDKTGRGVFLSSALLTRRPPT